MSFILGRFAFIRLCLFVCPDLDRISFAHNMHTSAHAVKVEQGLFSDVRSLQREQGRVKVFYQDLHVGSMGSMGFSEISQIEKQTHWHFLRHMGHPGMDRTTHWDVFVGL